MELAPEGFNGKNKTRIQLIQFIFFLLNIYLLILFNFWFFFLFIYMYVYNQASVYLVGFH